MNHLLRSTAAMAAVAMLFVSCKSDKTSSFTTDQAEFSDEVVLVEGRDDMFSIDLKVEYPVNGATDEVLTKMNSTIIEAVFGTDYIVYPVKKALETYVDDRIADFKIENLDLLEDLRVLEEEDDADEDENHAVDLSWDERVDGYFAGEHGSIVSYVVYSFLYDGGVHGQENEIAVNMNKETGDFVDEADFFIPGFETRLGGILSSHLLDSLGSNEDDYDSLFIKDIQPNGNFKVSPAGLTYIYSPYEIGPYSLGIIRVFVPWEEVVDLVRE